LHCGERLKISETPTLHYIIVDVQEGICYVQDSYWIMSSNTAASLNERGIYM